MADSNGAAPLSRLRVLQGLQCPRQLWWRVHDAGAPELTRVAGLEWTFEEARHVTERARGLVPGGVRIDLPHASWPERARATGAALESGARVLYQAAFVADGVYVQADILERLERGFALTAVRSSLSVKRGHLEDLAVQKHVIDASGIDVRRVAVIHLNRDCFHPDLSNLFVVEDVTAAIAERVMALPPRIRAMHVALGGPLPQVAIGPHCDDPRTCPFKRCWPPALPHAILSLYQSHGKLADLEAAGYSTIHDLPAGLDLNSIAERQRRAVQTGQLVVEPGLAAALEVFVPPLAYLDFETVDPAIPAWPGCRPYSKTPVQFSCHVDGPDGAIAHHHWLASGPGDPRPELAHRVADACRGANTVVAYFSNFEANCLETLALAAPERADELRAIALRLRDPLPVLREFVYHPEFRGSFSLKSVLTPLVPDLGYADLEIRDGGIASVQLKRLLLDGDRLEPHDREQLAAALDRYVERDTWALVRLMERLRELARGE